MASSVQIFLGIIIGLISFFRLADNPLTAYSSLVVAGFFILAGIDHMFGHSAHGRAEGGREA